MYLNTYNMKQLFSLLVLVCLATFAVHSIPIEKQKIHQTQIEKAYQVDFSNAILFQDLTSDINVGELASYGEKLKTNYRKHVAKESIFKDLKANRYKDKIVNNQPRTKLFYQAVITQGRV